MAYRDCPYTALYRAMNVSTGAVVTGDAANHTLKINADGTDATPARGPVEIAYGHYALHLSGAENTGARMMVHGSSSTSNVVLVPTSWNNRPAQIGCVPIATYGQTIEHAAYPPGSQGASWLNVYTGTTRCFWNAGHKARIRCNGPILGCRIYVTSAKGYISGLKFCALRWNGATWDRVTNFSQSFTGAGLSADQDNTLTFTTPLLGARRGDFLCAVYTASGGTYSKHPVESGLETEDWHLFYYTGEPGTGFSAAGVLNANAQQACPIAEAAPLMLIGDSFAAGHDGTDSFIEASGMAWESQPFEETIGGYLEDLLPALNYINHGLGGTRANQWATTGSNWVTTYGTNLYPRAAIISLGANDGVAGQTVAQLMASMVNIIHKLQSCGVLPILTTVLQTNVVYDWMDGYCEAIQKLAHSRGLPCIDGRRVLASSTTDSARDTTIFGSGVHPNAAGYRALAGAIAQQVVFAPSYLSLGRIENGAIAAAKIATDAFSEAGSAAAAAILDEPANLIKVSADGYAQADLKLILGTLLTETAAGRLAGRFKDFLDQATAGFNIGTDLELAAGTGVDDHSSSVAAILDDTGTSGVKLDATTDVYYADVDWHRDVDEGVDRYTVQWFKNGAPVTSGITTPTIQVVRWADGTNLIAETSMTQIGTTGAYRHSETTNKGTTGDPMVVVVKATIDASQRTWRQIVGRDAT